MAITARYNSIPLLMALYRYVMAPDRARLLSTDRGGRHLRDRFGQLPSTNVYFSTASSFHVEVLATTLDSEYIQRSIWACGR